MMKKYFYALALLISVCNSFGQTCTTPTALTVNNITPTAATLSWNLGNSETQWEVLVLPANATEPDNSAIGGLTTNTNTGFVINTLSPCTPYKFYVRAVCAPGETSNWSQPIGFNTISSGFSCNVTSNTLTINGAPNSTYTYSIDGGISQTVVVGSVGTVNITLPQLAPGTHNVMVWENFPQLACTCTSTFTVPESPYFATIFATQDIPTSALMAEVTGGTPPYSYQWSLNGAPIGGATSQIINILGLPGGVYQVTVTDAIGQTTSSTFIVQEAYVVASMDTLTVYPGSNGIATSATSVLSNDYLNGSLITPNNQANIILTPINLPSGFSINPNGTVSVLPGTAPGTYTLTYQICIVQSPNACSVGTVVVTVANEGFLLNAFVDTNNNGIQDNGESNFTQGTFSYALNGGTTNTVTTSGGSYYLQESNPANSYHFSYAVQPEFSAYHTVNPASYNNVQYVAGSGVIVYNFPVTVLPYADVAVTVLPYGAPPRPGFNYTNMIVYQNNGNLPIASGTITFTKDNAVTLTNTTPSGVTTTANGFTYDFVNLLPGESRSIMATMLVPTIPTVNLGGILTNNATATNVVADVNANNNQHSLTQVIVGSYDPNDKTESHGDRIVHATFGSNDYLTYTIQFENTGTYYAENVRISDVLDAKLDETTVKMMDASHAYNLVQTGTALTWNMNGIDLLPAGKGHVTFQIKPKAGYAIGDIIPNTASIYFDFNPAIVTNTFTTEFVSTMSVSEFNDNTFVAYPNPANGLITVRSKNNTPIETITLHDVLGKTVGKQHFTNTNATMDVSNLRSGIYFLTVEADNQKNTIKIVKQ
ncbi:DUF7619 domain-containing protein [Flavobacterium suncheonense]|uniref:Fibronectin type-III domain-containing protein n=1 Tax=Flavobacterium suncheonense GH29-5 = DSM 17707 TaxID=1121899 RepID=A0A0A2MFQ1_9FLAO|nr:T9SS type A sorting domain-containing protein [Flavobacterium suncheonense]KGO90436.1 hypothetical protein Q764_02470 [Flavobacterium suncheonense GH29-5 = DSM 17707]